jgi:hypothetical protein
MTEGVPVGYAEYMVMYEVERRKVAGMAEVGIVPAGGLDAFSTRNSAVVWRRTEKNAW